MSENEGKDTGAAWKLYMENYGLNFDIDNTVNCSSSNSSSSSSNTIMNSHGSDGVNPIQIPISSPFFTSMPMGGGGDVSVNNNTNSSVNERTAEIEFISSLFPLTSINSPIGTAEHPIGLSYGRDLESLNLPEDFINNQHDENVNDFTDDETQVIARMDKLQRLMDSRMENFTRSASTEQNIMRNPHQHQHQQSHVDDGSNNTNHHINPDDYVGDLIDDNDEDHDDEDSLDQYLQSYRQQSATDIHNNINRRSSSDTNQNSINNHTNNHHHNSNNSGPSNSSSSFNLDDEWRKLSQPRNHNAELTDFLMADLSFTPFSTVDNLYAGNASGISYENLNTATTSSSSSSNVPSTQTLRSNLNRLNSGLSRCEEKAENVQQMLEQLQGAIRSNIQSSSAHPSSSHTLGRGDDPNRNGIPLNHELEDAEYAEWDAETTLANGTAFLNFAFEYDDSNHEGLSNNNNSNHIQRDSRGMLRHFGSVRVRDMSPSTRDFHISIGYPINDDDDRGRGELNSNTNTHTSGCNGTGGGVQVLADSNLVMVAENPRSFPRNLIGEDTPIPLYVSRRDFVNSNDDEERSGGDSGVNSEDEAEEDSGIGATEDISTSMNCQLDKPDNANESDTTVETGALNIENSGDLSNQHNITLESNTKVSNLEQEQEQQQQPNLNLVDIENFSDVLREQGVVPPKIDFSDVEMELEEVNKKPLKASSKFSDEDLAHLQKLVKEELEKNCSLSEVEESPRVDKESFDGAAAGDGNNSFCQEEKKQDANFLFEEEEEELEEENRVQIKSLDEYSETGDEDEYNDNDIEYLVSDKDESEFRSEKEDEQEEVGDVESELQTDLSISILEFHEGEEVKSSEEKDLDAGGDTTSYVLEMSPSKISGFKAGLKSLKLKMCSCFNAKKCRLHDGSNSSHNLTSPRDPVERRRSSSSVNQ